MRRKTRIRLVRILKLAWIAIHIIALQITLNDCAIGDSCYRAQDNLVGTSMLLGFPGSFLTIFASVALFDGALRPWDFAFLWVAGLIGGYVQWFVLLPRLLKASKPITLGLSRIRPAPVTAGVTNGMVPTNKTRKKPVLRTAPRTQFDARGRTPLERALAADRRHN